MSAAALATLRAEIDAARQLESRLRDVGSALLVNDAEKLDIALREQQVALEKLERCSAHRVEQLGARIPEHNPSPLWLELRDLAEHCALLNHENAALLDVRRTRTLWALRTLSDLSPMYSSDGQARVSAGSSLSVRA